MNCMKKDSLFLFLLMLMSTVAVSQKYTISGYVSSQETGEKIIGAAVYNPDAVNIGTLTNAYGFFSITFKDKSKVKLSASYVGHSSETVEFYLTKDTLIHFSLKSAAELEEVEVYGTKTEARKTEMGRITVPVKSIKMIPALFGEVDVLKAMQLLPGVQSGTEGTSGFYVRGGGPDQNLILIDGVPVYNVNHLFGFFSVFNADAIKDVSIIKGGFPARYGGRLSSVLDIRMKEGNLKRFSGSASIGFISSKFTFEGPIVKGKTSFMISARRTYIDLLAKLLFRNKNPDSKLSSGYFFWDVNAKVNHKFSDKDRIYLSVYSGKDKAYLNYKAKQSDFANDFDNDLNWGNITAAFRWNHIFGKKLFTNTTLTYSRYKFEINLSENFRDTQIGEDTRFIFEYSSGIEDYGAKIDFDYNPFVNHSVKFGMNYIFHTFRPSVQSFSISGVDELSMDSVGGTKIYASEYALFAEDEIKVFSKLNMNVGVHYSGFYVEDTLYQSLQPRVSLRFMIMPKWSLKAAYTKMGQYLHLLTNSSIGLPTDLWLPVTKNVLPQKSTQYALGSAFSHAGFDFSVEAYYKDMNNLIEYKEGVGFVGGANSEEGAGWESKIETGGKGRSYGIEFFVKKNIGKLSGWIGYTLSKSERQFANVSFGKYFPYTYDRRHDIAIVLSYKLNDRIDFAGTWVYGTGNATTLALESYRALNENLAPDADKENLINHIEKRNNFRMPAYHRLDLGINFRKQKKYGKRTWSLGAYNVYNRKNPFFLRFEQKADGEQALFQYSLFPIIPSISYKYEF